MIFMTHEKKETKVEVVETGNVYTTLQIKGGLAEVLSRYFEGHPDENPDTFATEALGKRLQKLELFATPLAVGHTNLNKTNRLEDLRRNGIYAINSGQVLGKSQTS